MMVIEIVETSYKKKQILDRIFFSFTFIRIIQYGNCINSTHFHMSMLHSVCTYETHWRKERKGKRVRENEMLSRKLYPIHYGFDFWSLDQIPQSVCSLNYWAHVIENEIRYESTDLPLYSLLLLLLFYLLFLFFFMFFFSVSLHIHLIWWLFFPYPSNANLIPLQIFQP